MRTITKYDIINNDGTLMKSLEVGKIYKIRGIMGPVPVLINTEIPYEHVGKLIEIKGTGLSIDSSEMYNSNIINIRLDTIKEIIDMQP